MSQEQQGKKKNAKKKAEIVATIRINLFAPL